MIKFVNIRSQADTGDEPIRNEFALFDTVSCEFVNVAGDEVWNSAADLIISCKIDSVSLERENRLVSKIP